MRTLYLLDAYKALKKKDLSVASERLSSYAEQVTDDNDMKIEKTSLLDYIKCDIEPGLTGEDKKKAKKKEVKKAKNKKKK